MNEQVLAEFVQQFNDLAKFANARGIFDMKTHEGHHAHAIAYYKMWDGIRSSPKAEQFPNEFAKARNDYREDTLHGRKLSDFFNAFRDACIRNNEKYSRRKIKASARAEVASLKRLREYYQQFGNED